MSYLSHVEEDFFNTLMSDDDFYPWNPYDEQTEAFWSEQEKNWDFTKNMTDSDTEERSANLFAHFKAVASSISDSRCNQSNPPILEQMEKGLDNLAV